MADLAREDMKVDPLPEPNQLLEPLILTEDLNCRLKHFSQGIDT